MMANRNRIVDTYAKVRTGKLFLIILCSFCGSWMAWNTFMPLRYQFDPVSHGFPLLTLMLSVEASIAASVIIMSNQENDKIQREQLRLLVKQSEIMINQTSAIISFIRKEKGVDLTDIS